MASKRNSPASPSACPAAAKRNRIAIFREAPLRLAGLLLSGAADGEADGLLAGGLLCRVADVRVCDRFSDRLAEGLGLDGLSRNGRETASSVGVLTDGIGPPHL